MDLKTGDTRLLIDVCRKHGLLRNQAAYVLATAFHETAHTMKPVRETLASSDADAKRRLSGAWKSGKLPWVKADYWSSGWFGRGYVQLTHRANYQKAGQKLGVDLVGDPSKAMDPAIASQIIVRGMKEGWFSKRQNGTPHRLDNYITLQESDFREARRIVNGMDRAAIIAGLAEQYDALLKRDGYGGSVISLKPSVSKDSKSNTDDLVITPKRSLFAILAALFAGGGATLAQGEVNTLTTATIVLCLTLAVGAGFLIWRLRK